MSNIEFTRWPLIQTKLKENCVNIAGEIKRERFYRKSDFRVSSGVCLLVSRALTVGGVKPSGAVFSKYILA